MSDKTILEQWRAIAYDQQADRNKLQQFWAKYFNIEKNIYAQLLENPDEVVTGTVKELAEKFINFMMRPEIAAKNSDYIKYASPNKEALSLLPEEDATNPYLYPEGDITQLGEVFLDLGEFTTEYDKVWTEIKSS